MVYFYRASWYDFDGKVFVTRFFASSQADAELICEDLVDVSDGSWNQLKEDGNVVTVASAKFQLPAIDGSRWARLGRFSFRAGTGRHRHELQLRAVKATYLGVDIRSTLENPFGDLARFKTSEGEAFHTFDGARYERTNKQPL